VLGILVGVGAIVAVFLSAAASIATGATGIVLGVLSYILGVRRLGAANVGRTLVSGGFERRLQPRRWGPGSRIARAEPHLHTYSPKRLEGGFLEVGRYPRPYASLC